MKDYKDTLLMPETLFDMRANLAEKEPAFRKFWEENKIYDKSLELNRNNDSFVLHDGPPYANGNLHVGHALNKISKDIIVRRKSLEGFYSPFILGWDTHGLPIENKMLEMMNVTKDDLDPLELRKKAAEYANSQIQNQISQFKLMQLFTDYDVIYKTMHKKYEAIQLKLFSKMVLDGLVYKGLKPVFWSPTSQSALAEAEVEYAEHVSPRVIVRLKISKGNDIVNENDYLLIMTTTPWTLIANSGVAAGEEISYSLIKNKSTNENYVIATNLIDSLISLTKWEYETIKEFKGADLQGLEYIRPIKRDKIGPVVLGHHVLDNEGTGLVHMAPLFGEDDFIIGKKNRLEMIMHVDDRGVFNKEAGEYEGQFYQDANKEIGMALDKEKDLISLKFLKHQYPHDWRTHKPVIFRGVPQWFVSIEKIKTNIINALDEVKSYPDWAVERMKKMIESRDDWTISRQRTWGVPITIFYDKDEKPVIEKDIFDNIIKLVEEHGTDIWWEKEADELLPEKYRGLGFKKEMNIMDVWFDSGSSAIVISELAKELGIKKQFDVYFEGSDQYRGWFNSSLINSVAYQNCSPYKQLISHGFVLDEKQQKMSKSKGNVVDPLEIIKKSGADILRLWVANSEYSSDVTIGDKIINQNVEIYRWIRNSIKNILGNLNKFDYGKHAVTSFDGVHALINERIKNLEIQIDNFYDNYKFINVVKEINQFLTEMSAFYIEVHKDTLYCDAENDHNRRSVQTNLYHLLELIIKSLSPILPTTIEETYKYFEKANKQESVFLERFNNVSQNKETKEWEERFKTFFELKDAIYRKIEEMKKSGQIKRSNEVIVTLPEVDEFVKALPLDKLLIVAKVKYGSELDLQKMENSVKCQRCWNHFESNELNEDMICHRCETVVKGE